jgi:prevent-host-death family protein
MSLEPLASLAVVAASEVKTAGWRGVTRALEQHGIVVVTNHDRPQAVIVSVAEYEALVALAQQETRRRESAIEVLRRDFDARLAALRAPDAGPRLRSAMRRGPRLRGKVKAGASY